MKTAIRLKHLNINNPELNFLLNTVVSDSTFVIDTLFQDEATIERDYFHSKETRIKLSKSNALEKLSWLLKSGYKVTILDGSESHLLKYSPPLYNLHFNPLIKVAK